MASHRNGAEETAKILAPLVALSRRYGSDPAWVLAGGGNTSFKTVERLYVKASGFALGSIGADGFCEMARQLLDAIWLKRYPEETSAREDAALADLMAARVQGESKRPSVETLLHGFFPQAYVVHTHPSLVNGLSCSQGGEESFRRIFGAAGIWVPLVDPGFTLAKTVRDLFEAYKAERGEAPSFLVLQNHGLLVAGESPEEIDRLSAEIASKLRAVVDASPGAEPDLTAVAVDAGSLTEFLEALRSLSGGPMAVLHRADRITAEFASSREAFGPISRPFSPDHIVYAGHEYLRVDGLAALPAAWEDYLGRNGATPRIVLARGLGAFALAPMGERGGEAAAATASRAMELFVDSCKVAAYSRAFGGQRFMNAEAVAFIRNWEVERYRSSVSAR